MRKFEFIKPQTSVEYKEGDNYGRFVITPLERGYGITLGNALRRVLLSSMPGVAIVAIEIEGVEHEFMAIDGILEDVTEIILNLKNVHLTIAEEEFLKQCLMKTRNCMSCQIDVEGERVVTAGDLQQEQRIDHRESGTSNCNLEKNARFKARFFAKTRNRLCSAEENKIFCKDKAGKIIISRIAIDSLFTHRFKSQIRC
jgi:DNA-directed RNA polymerase subunit alpha